MNDAATLRPGKLSEFLPVAKAVIPAAGLGTRFLPATKVQPKEMLPIIDTPTIQYVVEEAGLSMFWFREIKRTPLIPVKN